MAGVFGKDPNMKKSNQAELERLNLERKRKLAEAALKFNQKRPVAPQQPRGSERAKQYSMNSDSLAKV
jgi:hypothetical protein